jgi:ribonuclease R
VSRALRGHRRNAGAIELDLPEADIVFGPDGRVADVVTHGRTEAHRAVEDAMLAANRAVAQALAAANVPAVYRNHEPPLPQDEERLRELFATFGLDVDPPRDRPRHEGGRGGRASDAAVGGPGWIAAGLTRVAGHREERLVHQVVLRSMTQARYGADCRGHFALAFSHYTHFTSPIRRYADLVVHRALKQLVARSDRTRDRPAPEDRQAVERMQRVAGRTSWRERVAVDAEREAVDLQKCAFLKPRVGETFSATMTGAAPFGLWLTLDEHFIEGLVHVSALSSYVEYDERRHAFRATGSGERFELGDRFEVQVAAVDQIRARIDFRILARRPGEADVGDRDDT